VAIGASAAELLFRAKGDTEDARKEFAQFRKEVKDLKDESDNTGTGLERLAHSTGLSASQFTSLAGIATGVVVGVGAIAAAGAAATKALFDLAKSAAEYGSEIYDASQKTGLSAETLSAMKFAADQSGTSLETITGSAAKFARTIDEAANGSDKAQAKLNRLGVTSHDLDTALAQALETIVKLPPGTDQMAASMDAFGRSGADLLPFIKSFDGDLVGLIQKAKELGITITDDAARAADEFGDQLDTLNTQLTGVGRTIGFEVMPVFNEMARDVSNWLTANKGEVKLWAETASYWLQRMIGEVRELVLLYQQASDYATRNDVGRGGDAGYAQRQQARDVILQKILNQRGGTDLPSGGGVFDQPDDYADWKSGKLPSAIPRSGPGSDDEAKKAEAARKAARKEALDLARRDLAAALRLAQDALGELNKEFDEKLDRMTEQFQKSGNREAFQRDVQALIEWYNTAWLDADATAIKIENDQAKRQKATKNELLELQDKQTDRQLSMTQRITDAREKAATVEQQQIEKTTKKHEDDAKKQEKASEQSARNQIAIAKAKGDTLIAQIQRDSQSEVEAATKIGMVKLRLLEIDRELETDATRQAILDEQIAQQKIANANAIADAKKRETDELNAQIEAALRAAALEIQKEEREAQRRFENEQVSNSGIGGGIADALGIDLVSIFDPDQVGVIREQAEYIKAIYADLSSAAGQAIGSMISGLAQLVTQWLFTGKFSAKAALQLASSVAISLAMQAGVKAIFELAEGWAAAAAAAAMWWNPPAAAAYAASAAMHFSAAAIYGTVAGVAGAVGVGLGLASRGFGNETSGGFGSADRTSTASSNRNTSGQGRQFSSFGDEITIVDTGINQAAPVRAEVLLRLNSDGVLDVVEEDANRNGRMKVLIEKYA
jgi:hypothetical protein